jgi:hypothetical protein
MVLADLSAACIRSVTLGCDIGPSVLGPARVQALVDELDTAKTDEVVSDASSAWTLFPESELLLKKLWLTMDKMLGFVKGLAKAREARDVRLLRAAVELGVASNVVSAELTRAQALLRAIEATQRLLSAALSSGSSEADVEDALGAVDKLELRERGWIDLQKFWKAQSLSRLRQALGSDGDEPQWEKVECHVERLQELGHHSREVESAFDGLLRWKRTRQCMDKFETAGEMSQWELEDCVLMARHVVQVWHPECAISLLRHVWLFVTSVERRGR